MRKEESAGGAVIKLSAIVALDTSNGASKLHEHVSEMRNCGEGIRLMTNK
jgi:hypothetical protein